MHEKDIEAKMIQSINRLKKNIKFLRKNANRLTLDDMARKVNISRDALFKIESSNRYPNIRTIMKIAYFHGIGVGDLLEKDLEFEELKSLSGDFENMAVN